MTTRLRVRRTNLVLVALALLWIYPVVWTLTNAVKNTADLYGGPLAMPIPPAFGNLAEAWNRANLGQALLNSAYVASLTVVGVLLLAIPAAFALTRLRPPGRAGLFLLILAPLIIPTEVLIVPLFSIYRTMGLINSLPGLALVNVVFSVSFATIILAGYFRRIPQDLIDAGRLDGAGRLALLTSIAIPLARPGIAVAMVQAVIATLNVFDQPYVLNGAANTAASVTMQTYFISFQDLDFGEGYALSLLITVVTLLVSLLVVGGVYRRVEL